MLLNAKSDFLQTPSIMQGVNLLRCGAFALVAAALLASVSEPASARMGREMVATTPFTESKATDAKGHVTYRVGAVFRQRNDASRRVSMTFICAPKKPHGTLSLLIVQQGASIPAKAGAVRLGMQMDGQPRLHIAAKRIVQMPLSAYSISNPGDARAAAQNMRTGQKLELELDGNEYDIPLKGFVAELRDLTAACPGWE